MRILVLAARDAEHPALGGGEQVLWEFAKGLARRGHEVDYLAATFPGAPRAVEREGVRVHRLASEALLGPAACAAYRRAYRGRVDAVLEDFLGGSRIPFCAPLYVAEPVIAAWHQDHAVLFRHQFPPPLVPALAGLERLLLRLHRRAHLLVPSEASRAALLRKGADPGRIRVFHPGIPPDLLEGEPPPARGREPLVVCLGKIRRYKAVHHAIAAFALLAPELPAARLAVVGRVGDPRYLGELRRLVERLGLGGRVAFELNVDEGRKRALLRAARALAAPAPLEGFGIAVVEAAACGLPTVGTTGVPEDALREGVNGFRVPFGDAAAMAGALRLLLGDDGTFDGLSARARAFARQFTWEAALDPLLALLEELPGA